MRPALSIITVCGQVCTIAEESTSDHSVTIFFLHLFPVYVICSVKVKDNSDNL